MLLTLKTLKQEVLKIEVETSDTVRIVKQKISEKFSYDADTQKLIFAGKILDDKDTIESYNIQEKDFVVLMVSKVPARPVSFIWIFVFFYFILKLITIYSRLLNLLPNLQLNLPLNQSLNQQPNQ